MLFRSLIAEIKFDLCGSLRGLQSSSADNNSEFRGREQATVRAVFCDLVSCGQFVFNVPRRKRSGNLCQHVNEVTPSRTAPVFRSAQKTRLNQGKLIMWAAFDAS